MDFKTCLLTGWSCFEAECAGVEAARRREPMIAGGRDERSCVSRQQRSYAEHYLRMLLFGQASVHHAAPFNLSATPIIETFIFFQSLYDIPVYFLRS